MSAIAPTTRSAASPGPATSDTPPQVQLLQDLVIDPAPEATLWLGGLGVRFLLDAARTGGQFSVVEHPILPRALAAPLHTHAHEDEYSLQERYGRSFDAESIPALIQRHGLAPG